MKKNIICLLAASLTSSYVIAKTLPHNIINLSSNLTTSARFSTLINNTIDSLNQKWFFEIDLTLSSVMIENKHIYLKATSNTSLRSIIVSINSEEGNQEWSSYGEYSLIDYAAPENLLIVMQGAYTNPHLIAINDQGKTLWTMKLAENFPIMLSKDKKTIFINSSKELMALDLNGKTKWAQPELNSKILALETETIYGLNKLTGNIIKAVDTNTGKLKWTITLDNDVYVRQGTVRDGILYLSVRTRNEDSRIYAISATGVLKWSYDIARYPLSNIVDINDHGIFVISQRLGPDKIFLLGFNKEEKWTLDKFNQITSIRVGPNGKIYLTAKGIVYSINQYGNIEWSYESQYAPRIEGIYNGVLYGFGFDKNDNDLILSYNLQTGAEQINYNFNRTVDVEWIELKNNLVYYATKYGFGALTQHNLNL